MDESEKTPLHHGAPQCFLSATSFIAYEGEPFNVELRLNQPAVNPVSLTWSLGKTKLCSPTSGTVDFALGESRQMITLHAADNDIWEMTKFVQLRLASCVGANLVLDHAIIYVVEDDIYPLNPRKRSRAASSTQRQMRQVACESQLSASSQPPPPSNLDSSILRTEQGSEEWLASLAARVSFGRWPPCPEAPTTAVDGGWPAKGGGGAAPPGKAAFMRLLWVFFRERYRRAHPKAARALLCVLYVGASKVSYTLILQFVYREIERATLDGLVMATGLYLAFSVAAVAWCERKHLDWRGASGLRRDLRHWLADKHLNSPLGLPARCATDAALDAMCQAGVETIASAWKAQYIFLQACFEIAVALAVSPFLKKTRHASYEVFLVLLAAVVLTLHTAWRWGQTLRPFDSYSCL